MKKIIYSTLILLIAISDCVFSQSLKELVNTALENNYQIKIYDAESQIAKNNNTPGNAGKLPSVGFDGRASTSLQNTKQVFADGTLRSGTLASNSNVSASLLANYTLFNGYFVQAKAAQLEKLEQLGIQKSKFFIEQTVADIALAYYQVVYEQSIKDKVNEMLTISDFRKRIVEKRKEVGSASGMEYEQAVVDFQNDSLQLLEQLTKLNALYISLNESLNQPLQTAVKITDALRYQTNFDNAKTTKLITTQNGQLIQSDIQAMLAENDIRMAKSAQYPKVNLFGGVDYSSSYAAVGFIARNRNLGPQVGVSINFNLFDGGNVKREIQNATINRNIAQLNRSQAEVNLQASWTTYFNEIALLNQQINLAKDNILRTEKMVNIATEQLKVGAINGFDFRTTQLLLINNELRLLQLKLRMKTIEINTHRLAGDVLEKYYR